MTELVVATVAGAAVLSLAVLWFLACAYIRKWRRVAAAWFVDLRNPFGLRHRLGLYRVTRVCHRCGQWSPLAPAALVTFWHRLHLSPIHRYNKELAR